MNVTATNVRLSTLNAIVFATLGLLIAGLIFIAREFGVGGAVQACFILALPMIVAVRLRCREREVQKQEVQFFLVLLCVAAGSTAYLVQVWYDKGFHRRYEESVRWSRFESEISQDPAFKQVNLKVVKKSGWIMEGQVPSEIDLERLKVLAHKHQVRWPLDKPWAGRVSLTVANSQTNN